MSSDWKAFFCATTNWNQKLCLVGYIVQRGTVCAVWYRLCDAVRYGTDCAVRCSTDCAVRYGLCGMVQTVLQCGTDLLMFQSDMLSQFPIL